MSVIPRLVRSMLATASMAGWFSALVENHRLSGPVKPPAWASSVRARAGSKLHNRQASGREPGTSGLMTEWAGSRVPL